MSSPRPILLRGFLLGITGVLIGTGFFLVYVLWYTGTDRLLPGVVVGATPIGGLRAGEARVRLIGASARENLSGMIGSVRSQSVGPSPAQTGMRLRWKDQVWPLHLSRVGSLPDMQKAIRAATTLGRTGSLWQKARLYLVGIVHGHYVPLDYRLKDQAVVTQLETIGREIGRLATNATYNFETNELKPERDGLALDVQASLDAVRMGMRAGSPEVSLVVRTLLPTVRATELASAKQQRVAQFTTPILAAEPGRVQNIGMAVQKISGTVVKPGDIFSFNGTVGPRDVEHGWAQAKEIYQGEYVMGYGGGICQVSSTLYNAVLLGGLEVKQRFHHDRPLQYVRPGRDATVVWNLLDFRFRNTSDVPILIGARVLPGSPKQIEVVLHAPSAIQPDIVRIEEGDIQYFPPPLEEVLVPTLPPGQRKVVDEGHQGIAVKIYRVYGQGDQERHELVSIDQYQPKPGKVQVGVGRGPGNKKLLDPGLQ